MGDSIEKVIKFYRENEQAVKDSNRARKDISEILFGLLSEDDSSELNGLKQKYQFDAEEIVGALSSGYSEKDTGFIDINEAKKDITRMMKIGKAEKAVRLLHTYEGQLNYRELVEAVVEGNFVGGARIPQEYVPKDIVVEYRNIELEYAAKRIESSANSIENPMVDINRGKLNESGIDDDSVFRDLKSRATSCAALALTSASNITEKLGEDVAPITRKMMQLAAGFNKLGNTPNLWTLDKFYAEQKEQNPELTSDDFLINYFSNTELMKITVPEQFKLFKENSELSIPNVLRAIANELREGYQIRV
ncbi:MAG: hypothetical protein ABIF85_06850 [Nanoarchaeota archaeon]|nr:hypothetical protein [Nanoarchaeota archaeon]MBU4451692.1 hypothetical protein [Nanoarchaeota archaeon]MCG2723603.1 hypothetical protein [archaeon]